MAQTITAIHVHSGFREYLNWEPLLRAAGGVSAAPQWLQEECYSRQQPAVYDVLQEIGLGTHTFVYLVQRNVPLPRVNSLSSNGGTPPPAPAAPEVFVAKITDFTGVDPRKLLYAQEELRCHAQVSHFAIAKQIDAVTGADGCKFLSVVELGEAGDLSRILKTRIQARDRALQQGVSPVNLSFQEHEVAFLFLQLILALDTLHRRRILHRDIKCANVFVKSNGLLKLGDFGFARQYEDTISGAVAGSFCGTPSYVAPELWRQERYGKKADIWSLGIVGYEITAFRRPFSGETVLALATSVRHGQFERIPMQYSDELNSIIAQMLAPQPEQRPNTAQILAHPYFVRTMRTFLEAVDIHPGIDAPTRELVRTAIEGIQQEQLADSAFQQHQQHGILNPQQIARSADQDFDGRDDDQFVPEDPASAAGGASPTAAAAPPADSTEAGDLFAATVYKQSAEGLWKRRVLKLSAEQLTVELLTAGPSPVKDQKHLRLSNINGVVALEEQVMIPAAVGGNDHGEHVELTCFYGFAIVVSKGARLLFASPSAQERSEWIEKILGAVEARRRAKHRTA